MVAITPMSKKRWCRYKAGNEELNFGHRCRLREQCADIIQFNVADTNILAHILEAPNRRYKIMTTYQEVGGNNDEVASLTALFADCVRKQGDIQ